MKSPCSNLMPTLLCCPVPSLHLGSPTPHHQVGPLAYKHAALSLLPFAGSPLQGAQQTCCFPHLLAPIQPTTNLPTVAPWLRSPMATRSWCLSSLSISSPWLQAFTLQSALPTSASLICLCPQLGFILCSPSLAALTANLDANNSPVTALNPGLTWGMRMTPPVSGQI